jgi:tetratricopeptide (TPR) repeat protein
MRRLNLRWLAGLILFVAVSGGLTYVLHRFQMTRIASAFLREGRRAQEDHRPADAARYFRSYVALMPDDIEGLELYGQELADANRVEPAYLVLEKVLRRDPSRVKVRTTLVKLGMRLGRTAEALANLDELLEGAPQDGELFELKGRCQIARGEYEQAKATLTSGIKNAPGRLESYGLLGALMNSKFKNLAEANRVLDLMVANNSKNFEAYVNRGTWRMQLLDLMNTATDSKSQSSGASKGGATGRQQPLAAIEADADKARKLAPKSAETLTFSSQVAVKMRNFKSACEYAAQGIKLHPEDARFYILLAEAELVMGKPAESMEVLRRGIVAAPNNKDLKWSLANQYLDTGKQDEAEAVIAELRAAGHPSELVGYLEARILLRRGQWLEAITRMEALRAELQQWPDLAKQADFYLGLAYREIDNSDQRVTAFRRAVALDSSWIPARVGLAESLLATNQVRQASEEYRRVLGLPGATPGMGIEFAKCLYRMNVRTSAANQDWQEYDQVLDWAERGAPDSVQVPILRAEKLVALGKEDEARELITKAREKSPTELDLCTVQITLAQVSQNWDEAVRLLDEATKEFGDNVTLRIVRFRYLLQRHGSKAASYLKTVSGVPKDWSDADKILLERNLTLGYLVVEDFDAAERYGRAVAEARPTDLTSRLILFDVALRGKRPQLMQRVLDEVRSIAGEGPIWHYGMAVLISMSGNIEKDPEAVTKARFHLAKAKTMRPTWPRIPLLYAQIETQIGDNYAATEYLQEAISLGERNPSVLSQTVNLLFNQKRFVDADQVVRRLQERQTLFDVNMIRYATEISMRLNDSARALDLAEQLARSSENTADKVWLAQVLGTLGKNKEAEQQLRNLIKAQPAEPAPWIALVQVFVRAGKKAEAERAIADAEQKMDPEQAPLAIAQCYEMVGRPDEARTNYEAALKKSPNNMIVIRRVVEFQLRTGHISEAEPLLRSILKNTSKEAERDRQWATRNLALGYAMSGPLDRLPEAMTLIETNLSKSGTASDERVKALILARQPGTPQRRQAIAIIEKLLTRESDTAVEDRFLLARLYLATGDRSKGRAELRTVLSAQGKDPRYIVAFLQLLLQSNETTEAELWLAKLRELAPNDVITSDFEVQMLFARNRYPEVLKLTKEVVNQAISGDNKAEMVQARQLWGAKRLEEFAQKLREAKKNDEADKFISESKSLYAKYVKQRPEEILAQAEFSANVGEIDQALDLLEQNAAGSTWERIAAVTVAVMKNVQSSAKQLARLQILVLAASSEKKGESLTLKLVLADLMSWRGEYEGAIRLYNEVLEKDKNNIAALNNVAMLLAMSANDPENGLRRVQQAMDLGGPRDVLLDTRGMVQLATAPAKALSDFEESAKENETAERFFHVALASAQLKQTEGAKRAFKRAQQLGLTEKSLHPLERPLLVKLKKSMGE